MYGATIKINKIVFNHNFDETCYQLFHLYRRKHDTQHEKWWHVTNLFPLGHSSQCKQLICLGQCYFHTTIPTIQVLLWTNPHITTTTFCIAFQNVYKQITLPQTQIQQPHPLLLFTIDRTHQETGRKNVKTRVNKNKSSEVPLRRYCSRQGCSPV